MSWQSKHPPNANPHQEIMPHWGLWTGEPPSIAMPMVPSKILLFFLRKPYLKKWLLTYEYSTVQESMLKYHDKFYTPWNQQQKPLKIDPLATQNRKFHVTQPLVFWRINLLLQPGKFRYTPHKPVRFTSDSSFRISNFWRFSGFHLSSPFQAVSNPSQDRSPKSRLKIRIVSSSNLPSIFRYCWCFRNHPSVGWKLHLQHDEDLVAKPRQQVGLSWWV